MSAEDGRGGPSAGDVRGARVPAPKRGLVPDLRTFPKFLGQSNERWETLLPPAILVGLASGLAAVGLRSAVHALFGALEGVRSGPFGVALPAAGAALGVTIVAYVFREPAGHGVPEVIRAVCRTGGRMRRRSTVSRFFGSLVNVSSGGSAGLEGPIVYSAAAIGSSLGGMLGVDERRRTVFLACGVAGGISGIFNAPMTGMIFATEVVLAEYSAFAIVPIVISAVSATALSRLVLGNEAPFMHPEFVMGTRDLVACGVLGLLAGLVSIALVRGLDWTHRAAGRVARGRLVAPVLFGLLVGGIGLLAPGAIGEGYDTTQAVLNGELAGGAPLLAGLLVAKVVATLLTLGSGAPGGIFAPCLVIGALLGATFAAAAGAVLPETVPLAEGGSFALAGMSGLLAGVLQAPLTGIFLVMEVTRGYEVILPLMIVSVLSLVVSRRFDRHSLYERELAESGELLRLGTDQRILADVAVAETLDADVTPIREDMTVAELVEVVKRSARNHFPVLRADGEELAGVLHLSAVRELLFEPLLAQVTLVSTMMDADAPTVPYAASLADALPIFEESGAWVLPVVEGTRFMGLLSKSTLFDQYRRELAVQGPE